MTRVLVWGMTNNKAGTEAVISNLVSLAPKQVIFDYLTFESLPNWPNVTANGGKVIQLPNKRTNYCQYKRAIREYFRDHADEYSILWSNLNILNNVDALKLASKYGIPKRILHAHNSRQDGKPHQRLLCALNKTVFDEWLTDRWACSPQSGKFFYGDKHFKLVPNAIEMSKYSFSSVARRRVREELGVEDKFVIGTVGRLAFQKNQELLVRCMPGLLKRRPDSHLVIVGQGELEQELKQLAEDEGVTASVSFVGTRNDIPEVLSAFDVFAFPSRYEGFSIVLLEAQANGLPCVISSTIADDPIISRGCRVVDINDEKEWASSLLDSSREHCELISDKAHNYDLSYQAETLRCLFI